MTRDSVVDERSVRDSARRRELAREVIVPGALAGILGGLLFGTARSSLGMLPAVASIVGASTSSVGFFVHMAVALGLGVGFGFLLRGHRHRTVETLFWGVAYGAFWWFCGELTLLPLVRDRSIRWGVPDVQKAFPSLVGHLLYGAALGVALIGGRALIGKRESVSRLPTRAVGLAARGGIAGLAAGAIVGACLAAQSRSITPPGLVGSSELNGWSGALLVGLVVGVAFALLHGRGLGAGGPALVRGMALGLTAWVVLGLTILPLLFGNDLPWSLRTVRGNFATLVAYLILGGLAGFFARWLIAASGSLFGAGEHVGAREGAGTEGLRALGRGLAAGSVGGLVFTLVLVQVGALHTIARITGAHSSTSGFFVHLSIAVTFGTGYALLFRQQSYDITSALAWGLSYGFFWWLFGALTFAPVLLGGTPDWSTGAVAGAFASLIGHLAYGAALGMTFHRLEARHRPWWVARTTIAAERARDRRAQLMSSAPAVWALMMVVGMTLPVVLAAPSARVSDTRQATQAEQLPPSTSP